MFKSTKQFNWLTNSVCRCFGRVFCRFIAVLCKYTQFLVHRPRGVDMGLVENMCFTFRQVRESLVAIYAREMFIFYVSLENNSLIVIVVYDINIYKLISSKRREFGRDLVSSTSSKFQE